MRRGGEQSDENNQSVTKVNQIRPNLSGSQMVYGEPSTAGAQDLYSRLIWSQTRRATTVKLWTDSDTVVEDGMVGRSSEKSREICRKKVVDSLRR